LETAKRLYEGLFLLDSAEAAADWNGVIDLITRILERGQAEIISTKKWDDRRLAYDIERKNRGTYILVYFNTEPKNITGIERDIRLSERIMRALIIRADKVTKEDMERPTPIERGPVTETSSGPSWRPAPAAPAPHETPAPAQPAVQEAPVVETKD
jgi:small subunit ribosomal protein S6